MEKILNIAIIAPNILPVPAVKGGAIENIIENLVKENEIYKSAIFTIYSIYDESAKKESEKYNNSTFKYINADTKEAKIYEFFRKLIAKLSGKIMRDYYIREVLRDVNKSNYDGVVIEGDIKYVNPLKKNRNRIDIYLHIHHDALKPGSEEIIEP